MVLLIDGSSSIKPQWENIKDFIIKLLDKFDLSPDVANFAIALYSSESFQSVIHELSGDKMSLEFSIRKYFLYFALFRNVSISPIRLGNSSDIMIIDPCLRLKRIFLILFSF